MKLIPVFCLTKRTHTEIVRERTHFFFESVQIEDLFEAFLFP